MILNKQDSVYAATKMMNYFKDFKRIDDYFRARKIERVKDIPSPLPGMSIEDDLFQDFDMHPEDMNFQVVEIPNKVYDTLLEKTASFSPDENPGKTLKLVVKETTTNTIVGFIRYGSPLINSKPRNDFLGGVPDLDIFNKRAIMGFNIVPVQPFGYNYLGGKLMAAICNSHAVRRMLDKKYDTEFCLFETTSLYGNLKGDIGGILNGNFKDSKLLNNLIGGSLMKMFNTPQGAQAVNALLTGDPTGQWHVTIGNPLNPIAVIGNLACETTEVVFEGPLGIQDFPEKMTVTITLKPARPRDKAEIESMFNSGRGRFYVKPHNTADINNTVDVSQYGNKDVKGVNKYSNEFRKIVNG